MDDLNLALFKSITPLVMLFLAIPALIVWILWTGFLSWNARRQGRQVPPIAQPDVLTLSGMALTVLGLFVIALIITA